VNFSRSSSIRTPTRRSRQSSNASRISLTRGSIGNGCTYENAGQPTSPLFGLPTNLTGNPDSVPAPPVWAWMAQDRWWPAEMLAPTPRLPTGHVTVRLTHGVSITIPIRYVVRREPDLGERDRPLLAPDQSAFQLAGLLDQRSPAPQKTAPG